MKKSNLMMILGSLCLLALFVMPMWIITLEAPQYPDGIGMDIWINKIEDHNPNDIKNINLMNHYVGMKPIPDHMKEFDIFPYVIGIMSAFGVIIGVSGNRKLFLTWFIVMVVLGAVGMYDFYIWEYDYGHNLDPKAAIKIPGQGYQPPLIGSKQILNFTAHSWPAAGAYFLFTGILMSLGAFLMKRKEQEQNEKV
ncbi:hypothetical protein AB2B38_003060 [Balneola sp. MJW-20]|uniref:hypothetical protein n=1 Tax=Gracilimonas aurantiaca TaxID=3234185 RepID=UPI0034656735